MSDEDSERRRPVPVTFVTWLVVLAGIAVVVAGIALVVERDNELVQLPALMARIDEALPFDEAQDLDTYLTGVGVVVAVLGVVVALLGWTVRRGRAWGYVVLVLLLGAGAAGAVWLRGQSTDDLETLAVTALGAGVAVLVVLLLGLLVGRRSRAWVLGRDAGV